MLKSFRSKAMLWYCSGFAVLSLLLMATTTHKQRPGDMLAETAVRRVPEPLPAGATAVGGNTP